MTVTLPTTLPTATLPTTTLPTTTLPTTGGLRALAPERVDIDTRASDAPPRDRRTPTPPEKNS